MHGHWFLVASQKEVRIFTEVKERNCIKQIAKLENPLGRERNRALVKKEAGTGIKTIGRTGIVQYSQKKRNEPHEEASLQFARVIAKFLKKEHLKKNFLTLSVIAEPHFIGKIKSAMKVEEKKCVTDWIKKDLQKTPKLKLQNILVPKKDRAEQVVSA